MMRIAVDIDEVLTPFLGGLTKFRRPKIPVRSKYPYVYRDIYGISERESQKMVREFYDSEEFYNLPLIPYAHQAMVTMKKRGNKLYVVTGRQEVVREKTEEWIERNFPGIFTDVILTNSFTPNEVRKSDVCEILSIDRIFDDSIRTCRECIDQGIAATNFIGDPVYPWCAPNPIAIQSWKKVCDTLTETPETFSEPFSKNSDLPASPKLTYLLDLLESQTLPADPWTT
jgi:5'(3')-deoxyribonucleotidase